MRKVILLAVCLLVTSSLWADDGAIRIYISDSESWSIEGGSAGGTGGGRGGARPQTVEIMKTFQNRCPIVTVTIKKEKADYIVFLDHEGGKALVNKDNKVAVFDSEGDMFFAASTRSLGNAVKDACKAIREHADLPEN